MSQQSLNEIEQLEQAIAALETQRSNLGSAVVDPALTSMRSRLESLRIQTAQAEARRALLDRAQQRKLITVLFADLSGFTAMSVDMDTEDVNDVINAVWHLFTT